MTTTGFTVRSVAVAVAIGWLTTSGTTVPGAPLILNSGNITIDTDALTVSGDATAAGMLVGGVATFTFDGIDLGSGVTVTLQGANPLSLVSTADFSLASVLDASGQGQTGLLGGGSGGNQRQAGMGLGAGGGSTGCCWGGGGGGFGGAGGGGPLTPPPNNDLGSAGNTYGDASLGTLSGGSGAGGGGDCCGSLGNVGGAGGGAIDLYAAGQLTLASSAQVLVDGADGNPGNQSRTGGGGSGGAIRLRGLAGITIDAGAQLRASGGDSPPLLGSRVGGGGGGGRVALFTTGTVVDNATVDVSGGTSLNNAVTPALDFSGQSGTLNVNIGGNRLLLNAGSFTIDTDAATITHNGTGDVVATGSLVGNVATFRFNEINLGAGANFTFQGDHPLSLRSTGDITIATTLDASGGDGQPRTGAVGGLGGTAPGGLAVLGGGEGGRGGLGSTAEPGLPGEGPGGGGGQTACCGGGSGGGYGGLGGLPNTNTANAQPAGAIYGDELISVLLGGSAGGGGAGTDTCCPDGGGGGAGGGAIELVSESGWITITADGEILVDGGDGAGNRAGGGGSGGAIRLLAELGGVSIEDGGLLSAEGGISHLTSARGGGGGAGGRILLWANRLLLDGVPQGLGLLDSNAFLSVLGGPGSSHAQGGNPGGPGTILFAIPEPGTIVLLGLGGLALLGFTRRRRSPGAPR